ncbi:MAG: hypothetical protein H6492_02640 [Candidatus Paracaedibacteraceae bacterium]|nr:hypothetical protein [Candidatus Paracaedibacteraceae bacterium]
MLKSILKLVLIIGLGILIVFTYQTKGYVDVRWQGVSISMKMGTFVLLVLLTTWVLFYIFSFIQYLSQLTKNLKNYWRKRHDAEGGRYMEESISAMAGGLNDAAYKKARRAKDTLTESVWAKLIYVFSAREAGAVLDDQSLVEIIKSKTLGLAGYRLRIEQLIKQGDNQWAITEAQAALERYPNSIWILETLFKLYIYQKKPNEGMSAAKKLYQLGQPDAESKMALCYLLHAQIEIDKDKKLKHLQMAFDLEKSNSIVALELSKVYISDYKYKKAQKVIEEVWKYSRQPELGDLYLETLNEANSDEIISSALRLLEISNSSLEGYIVVIKACIKQEFYQKARYYLEKAIQANGGMSLRLFELRVALTQKDGAEKLDYYTWFKQVISRMPFEGWDCAKCNAHLSQWEHICIRCGEVNSFYWQGEHEYENSFFAIKRA